MPAALPIPVQEASRAARVVLERVHRAIARRSGGRVAPLRLGWVNFEFLRSGRALGSILDDLRAEMWDREAIRGRITQAADPDGGIATHPLSDQMMKIYTSDLMLRP